MLQWLCDMPENTAIMMIMMATHGKFLFPHSYAHTVTSTVYHTATVGLLLCSNVMFAHVVVTNRVEKTQQRLANTAGPEQLRDGPGYQHLGTAHSLLKHLKLSLMQCHRALLWFLEAVCLVFER